MSHVPSWRSTRVVVFTSFLGLIGLGLSRPAAAIDQPECSNPSKVPNLAMNCPDLFAWQKFIEVNSPAVAGLVAFQTYSSDPDTFQCPAADFKTCKADPKHAGCPVWPTDFTPKPSLLTQRSARAGKVTRHGLPEDDCWSYYNNEALEIVYRDRATFNYIADHGLWYVEGLQVAFEQGFVFNFPVGATEVKTNWLPLSAEQVASKRFYTMMSQGKPYGLVAMHVSSKALPNWFWSTFEHVDNWGRCDFLGCHDSFGSTPENIPSHEKELCGKYTPGELTQPLQRMMEAAKLDPVFKNYRLKGSMTDYTDATGSPILLGNSVTEAGFVPTASCMTCHSRATIQATPGGPNGLSPYPGVAGFTPEGQSYNGTPNPSWYYSGNHAIRRWSVQTDFVWALPFKAQSDQATAQCCQAFNAGTGGTCQCSGQSCN